MIGDIARRYAILTGTPQGRRTIAAAMIGVAAVISACATFLPPQHARAVLTGAAVGMFGVGCIFLVRRKAR